MNYSLTVGDVADEEIRKGVLVPLVAHNDSRAGPSGSRPITIALRNAGGAVIGGLWGHTGYEWMFVQYLAVPAELRGSGVGREIMRLAEQEALRRGCRGAWLDTFEFQARGFYERLGYECFGELADYPPGQARYFMRKQLA